MSAPAAAPSQDQCTILQAINWALDDALAQDPAVIMFGEDLADNEGGGVVGVTRGLSTRHGDVRVRSTPIAEQAIIGAAIGASLAGFRPVAEIMLMNFTTVAMDMIVNHAAKLRYMSGGQTHVPITIRTMTGAGRGSGGQHTDMLEAWFGHVAGIKVVVPSSPAEAYGLMLSCIFDNDPCLFIENLPTYWTKGPAPVRGTRIPLSRANIVREGKDVSLITYGRQVADSLPVVNKLAAEGISVELVDLRTVSPMDTDTIVKSVEKTGRAVVLHEAVRSFGAGAEIATRINEALFGKLKSAVVRVTAPDNPVPFSKPLETAQVPSAEKIEAGIRAALK